MPQGADKQLQHMVGVANARPVGQTSADAVIRGTAPRGAVPYISDTPYVPPTLAYSERPLCKGTRRDTQPCKAKARAGGTCCEAHLDQE